MKFDVSKEMFSDGKIPAILLIVDSAEMVPVALDRLGVEADLVIPVPVGFKYDRSLRVKYRTTVFVITHDDRKQLDCLHDQTSLAVRDLLGIYFSSWVFKPDERPHLVEHRMPRDVEFDVVLVETSKEAVLWKYRGASIFEAIEIKPAEA